MSKSNGVVLCRTLTGVWVGHAMACPKWWVHKTPPRQAAPDTLPKEGNILFQQPLILIPN